MNSIHRDIFKAIHEGISEQRGQAHELLDWNPGLRPTEQDFKSGRTSSQPVLD